MNERLGELAEPEIGDASGETLGRSAVTMVSWFDGDPVGGTINVKPEKALDGSEGDNFISSEDIN